MTEPAKPRPFLRPAIEKVLRDLGNDIFDDAFRAPPRSGSGLGREILGWRIFTSPGWVGVRRGDRYVYLRDVDRHRLLFSERNRRGCRRLAVLGRWELWSRP